MKRVLFIIISLFCLVGNVLAKENEPLKVVSVVNKCSVVEDKIVVIPVNVIGMNNGSLTSLIDEYTLGYIDNNNDIVKVKITSVDGVNNVIVDNNRNSEGMSLIKYYLDNDINAKELDKIMSFNIQLEFINEVPDVYNVLGTEVLLSDNKSVCEKINGYEIKEVEKIKYVDLSKVDHSEMINNLIVKVVMFILIGIIVILSILLIKRKK